jgi:DNA polymerase III delta prime subunit
MSKEFLWTEKYRPKTVMDCILPDRIKNTFQEYVTRKEIPNMLLAGGPGIGKTTVALAMCEEIGLSHMIINSSEERGIDTLRTKVLNYATSRSLTGGRKVIILDEADNLTADAQAALRGIIESVSTNCTFIMTCNFKAKLTDAIHSRMPIVEFNLNKDERKDMAGAFFKRLRKILTDEKIVFEDAVLAKIVTKYFPDYRRTLGELQKLSLSGNIDSAVLNQVADIRNIRELVAHLKAKDFTEVRKWVVDNGDVDAARIFRRLYDGMYDIMEPSSIPQAVVILAKYQYQSAFVADQEINLVACLTEIMVDCGFK